eukprot:TRINITY_DN19206_c0_g1_i2.p1 TRINITY_DN19206_c0_g1~~TRINITY_DN19206_c0_g1_i2.p1  ORF type:complete len:192 (+),score=23.73 TRINITY_DN19206_c0_g1_i2:460-1035(+)
MNTVTLKIVNKSGAELKGISLTDTKGIDMSKFDDIPRLGAGAEYLVKLHIDFQAKTTPIKFKVKVGEKEYGVKLAAECGELMKAYSVSHDDFKMHQNKLSGMNEQMITTKCSDLKQIPHVVTKHFNVAPLSQNNPNTWRFSSRKLADNHIILVEVITTPESGSGGTCNVRVNCDDFILSNTLIDILKKVIT